MLIYILSIEFGMAVGPPSPRSDEYRGVTKLATHVHLYLEQYFSSLLWAGVTMLA
jgi:hypothetical protein